MDVNDVRRSQTKPQPILKDWFRDVEPRWRSAAIGRPPPEEIGNSL